MNSTGATRKPATAMDPVTVPPAPAVANAPGLLTPEPRRYAIGEIARRAGVSEPSRKAWRIEVTGQAATIYLEPDGRKKIVFPAQPAPQKLSDFITAGGTSRASWVYPPGANLQEVIPDFVVPFVGQDRTAGGCPVFSATDPETIRFNFDLPTAALLTLGRAEETLDRPRDTHGRFPASASIAVKEGFLHRPIVDEYGFAFEQALSCLLPQWSPGRKPLRVKLSHDIDLVGIPFSLRSTLGHTLQRGTPRATFQDFLSLVTDHRPAYLQAVFQLAQFSADHGLDSAFYWKASPFGRKDSGYDPRHPKIRSTVRWLNENGFENGVHPGYETFLCNRKLRAEVETLRECIGSRELGGRQHYLRWLPETWSQWEDCGLAYDSSVGFAEQIGFRAGTCVPYRPWLWEQNREARLLEIPLIVMDRTLASYMQLSPQESYVRVLDCVRRCRAVGGVFTMLWHNDTLLDQVHGDLYSRLLEYLSGSARFDRRAPN